MRFASTRTLDQRSNCRNQIGWQVPSYYGMPVAHSDNAAPSLRHLMNRIGVCTYTAVAAQNLSADSRVCTMWNSNKIICLLNPEIPYSAILVIQLSNKLHVLQYMSQVWIERLVHSFTENVNYNARTFAKNIHVFHWNEVSSVHWKDRPRHISVGTHTGSRTLISCPIWNNSGVFTMNTKQHALLYDLRVMWPTCVRCL